MMNIDLCTYVMYYIVGSHLRISLIFISSLIGALGRIRRYNSHTHSITKILQITAGRYMQKSTHINNYVHVGM